MSDYDSLWDKWEAIALSPNYHFQGHLGDYIDLLNDFDNSNEDKRINLLIRKFGLTKEESEAVKSINDLTVLFRNKLGNDCNANCTSLFLKLVSS